MGRSPKYPADPDYYGGWMRGQAERPAALKRVEALASQVLRSTRPPPAPTTKPVVRSMQPRLERELAQIVRALPRGMTFLEWYSAPNESEFVGSPAVRHRAQESWDYLQGVGDGYGLTVRELLDAEGVEMGPDPYE